jgi:hypothetical protein
MIDQASGEIDPSIRHKSLDQAAQSLSKLIETSSQAGKKEEDIIKTLGYRLKLVDLLGRSQCAMHADFLLTFLGGQEDRRVIMDYTGRVLSKKEGANSTRSMLEELQDEIDTEIEKVHGDPAGGVNDLPLLQTLQNEVMYSSAWFHLYRGLASSVLAERAEFLRKAIVYSDKYAKGQWEGAQGPDPASLLLQGEASTELAITWLMKTTEADARGNAAGAALAKADAERQFLLADTYLKTALDCKGAPDDQGRQTSLITPGLKGAVLYQIARNLIEWGKYDQALKAIDEYGPVVGKLDLPGKDAAIRADANAAVLKNHLYSRWAENTADKDQAETYRLQSQKVLLDFSAAHKDLKADTIVCAGWVQLGAGWTPFDPNSGSGGHGPMTAFLGNGGTALHVVFCIDASGSMAFATRNGSVFDVVRSQMLTSISRLTPAQDFHVVMFEEGPPIELPTRKLQPVTLENRMAAAHWLNQVIPHGAGSDPVPALNRCFDTLNAAKGKGKVIFLLTDGAFPNNDAVSRCIKNRNRAKDVHVFTYLYGPQADDSIIKLMKDIAIQNGGKYKNITE